MSWLGGRGNTRAAVVLKISLAIALMVAGLFACGNENRHEATSAGIESVDQYIRFVQTSFTQQYQASLQVQQGVKDLLQETSNQRLVNLRAALENAQLRYARTLITKHYPNPYTLTASITEAGSHALARINSWPLDPAYLEDKKSGLISSPRYQINSDNIRSLHTGRGAGEATLGLSVLEVLLWAPRLDADAQSIQSVMPTRSISDFSPGSWTNERRRRYLRVVADQLVADTRYMRDAWVVNKDNFAAKFANRPSKQVYTDIFNGLVGLVEKDMIQTGLWMPMETRTPQWLPAAFSNNTLGVLQAELQAIVDVYEGVAGDGSGLRSVVAATDQASADRVSIQLKIAQQALGNLSEPLAGVVSSNQASAGRKMLGVSLTALVELAQVLRSAATAMKLTLKTPEEMARKL